MIDEKSEFGGRALADEGRGGRVVKDMEDIKIARDETDLEWRPVLDGVHAYADLRRLGRKLAVERLKTDETIAYLTGQLERAISNLEKLTRERNKMRAEVEELRTRAAAQLEIETRARDEARADAARLHEALEALTDQTGSLLSELEYQQVSCPLCGEDPGEGKDALCRVVKALGEASSKARAAGGKLARQFASSSELLEALEDYVAADTIAIGHGYGVGGEARDKALAAIAKAKGETNE